MPYDWAERFVPHLRVPETLAITAASMVTVWENSTPAQQSAPENTLAFPYDISAMAYPAQWISVDHAINALEAQDKIGDLAAPLAFVDFFGFAIDAVPARDMKNSSTSAAPWPFRTTQMHAPISKTSTPCSCRFAG